MMGCPHSAELRPPEAALTDADAVLAKVAERAGRLQSLSVEARVSYYGKEGARKAKAVILARRPAALHFSAYSPTDDMLAVMASDGERFTSFERGAETCYAGRSCAENIGRFSFFPLEGAKLVDALFGGVPLIWASSSAVTWDGRAGAYRIERLGAQGVSQLIWVTHKSWDVSRIEILRSDVSEISIEFSDVTVVAGERLPHTISMKMPAEEIDLRVRYREVDLNTTLSDEAFQIPCPEGMVIQTLRCDDELPDTEGTGGGLKGAAPEKDDADGS